MGGCLLLITTKSTSRAIQDFLICIEMVIVSIAFLFAFTYKPYTPEVLKLALFDKVISPIRTPTRGGAESEVLRTVDYKDS